MKVVINDCYGGFSLSAKAVERIAQLQGKEAYFYITEYQGSKSVYTPKLAEEIDVKRQFFHAFDTELPDNKPSNEWYREHMLDTRQDDRSNPLLVQVVGELGPAANGFCAELRIVDIPDGVDWEIEDYDGVETIHEQHRIWR